MHWRPFRITEVWAKVAYVVVAWLLAPTVLRSLLGFVSNPEPALVIIDLAFGFVVVGVGSRVFRARGEAVEPPRVWWRATGRPTAGFVLFGLFFVSIVSAFIPYPDPVDPFVWWYVVTGVSIAAFYLHSSIRLVRGDAPVPPRPRRDDDAQLIDRRQRL